MRKLFLVCLIAFLSTVGFGLTWRDPNTGLVWNYFIASDGSVSLGQKRSSDGIYTVYGTSACEDVSRSEIIFPSKINGRPVRTINLAWGRFALHAPQLKRSVKKVVIPEGVEVIAASAFDGADIECIQLPSSLRLIHGAVLTGGGGAKGAFYNCYSLKEVIFSENTHDLVVERGAFDDCDSLTSLTNLTDGVMFEYDSDSLTELVCYKDGVYESNAMKTFVRVSRDISDTTVNFTIPLGVQFICGGAFQSYEKLTSITIPEGVEGIGRSAFINCTGLTSVTLPKSLKRLGNDVFTGCTGFPTNAYGEQYEGPEKNVLIRGAFGAEVTIPASVRFIHSQAFQSRSSLTSITIPSSVISIGDSAFSNCKSLTSITIPSSVTSIGDSAFFGCSGLTSVTIPSSVTSIGDSAFLYCSGLTSVTIPSSVTSIGDSAFQYCSGLTSVTIPSSVTSIRDEAFYNCSSLTSVTIPSSVTSIGEYAFSGCSGLTSITIPSSVTSIGRSAFYNCSGLTSITIPEGVTSIPVSAFRGCSGLTSITIPEGVTSIGDDAFSGCSGLTSITIPSSVTSIGDDAFSGCSGLTSVIFEGNPPEVGTTPFPACNGYYPLSKADAWTKACGSSVFWNELRMSSYQLVNLTFNANGGTGGSSAQYMVGEALKAPTVARKGYTFKGWEPSVPDEVPSADTTYVAQWQVNQYKIVFNANGGTGGQTVTQDYDTELSAPTVEREGYTFLGWEPGVPSRVPAQNMTYTAQWCVNQYTQTFDANGGEGGVVLTQNYGTELNAPVVTRERFTFMGWNPEVPSTVPAQDVTYVAQWDIVAPSWEAPGGYQNNMTLFAQVKDVTTGTFIDAEGSLLAAFDADGVCRGVKAIGNGPNATKVYQVVICSNTASGETFTLKVWNAATGEMTDLTDTITFVADTVVGAIAAPIVYQVGYKQLETAFKPGWNWFSINVDLPEDTTLAEAFSGWTPANDDQIKSSNDSATYYDGVWYPEDFKLEAGKMYLLNNTSSAAVTATVQGTPVPYSRTYPLVAGWNWMGYTGATSVAVDAAFADSVTFSDDDMVKSSSDSATYYDGVWYGSLELAPGTGYKFYLAQSTTLQYAQPSDAVTLAAVPALLTATDSAPEWVAVNCQYNMTVYAVVQDNAGTVFGAEGSLLAAFDADGVCRGVEEVGNGPNATRLYQLVIASDKATESGLSLKLWNAADGAIYDLDASIDFEIDGRIGKISEPQAYTVKKTEVKCAVSVTVVGKGAVTGAGEYAEGDEVTLTAAPADGSFFCGWNTEPVTTAATYTFTMGTDDVILTACFAPISILDAHIDRQGLLTPDEAAQKRDEYIAEHNLKTESEVTEAIEQHITVNNLMSKDAAKQMLLDADEVYTKDEMKEMAFDAPVVEVGAENIEISISLQTADSLDAWQAMALQGATLEVDQEAGKVRVIVPKGDKKAAFYKFVVPKEQSK